jgi:ureidoglycolate amidohydrolase
VLYANSSIRLPLLGVRLPASASLNLGNRLIVGLQSRGNSKADCQARAFVRARCSDLKLGLREDAVGNVFARWAGEDVDLPAVATGSHIDAIPNAGKYDGVVGVLGALEAIRGLQRAGFKPRRSIELVIFTAEEPTRFGIGCLGSRLLGGVLMPEQALQLTDSSGKRLSDWLGEIYPRRSSIRSISS